MSKVSKEDIYNHMIQTYSHLFNKKQLNPAKKHRKYDYTQLQHESQLKSLKTRTQEIGKLSQKLKNPIDHIAYPVYFKRKTLIKVQAPSVHDKFYTSMPRSLFMRSGPTSTDYN